MPRSKSDHALALIKAGISAVPGIGGPIASLIGDYIPNHTQRSIERLIDILKEILSIIENRIDLVTINKDELAELFKSAYFTTVRTHQEEKIRAAAALITNLLLKNEDEDKLSYTEIDHFARSIDSLSVGAIKAMGHIFDICTEKVEGNILGRSFNHSFDLLQGRWPNIEPSLLMGLVSELNAFNLVHIPGAPSIRTANYGNYNIELTPLGVRFVKYLFRWPDLLGRED